jgi:antitoxin component YwqK of YwqJK toxin-antitoxin module
MEKNKSPLEIVMEWYPDGNFTEEDLWEAIAESDGHQRDYYEDGDLAEWL